MVPLGKRLFGELNPVRTAGPMQVSISYSEQHAREKHYPYPVPGDIRDEVFTRRGGLYFGIAHLLDYPAPYDQMLFRFAITTPVITRANCGVSERSQPGRRARRSRSTEICWLSGGSASAPSNTELAIRKLRDRLGLSDSQIHGDLERGTQDGFEKTKLYSGVFELANEGRAQALPRAVVPKIRLQSPKITRKLTTEWFARRVNERYERCLSPKAKR